jgi:hypothetical protein
VNLHDSSDGLTETFCEFLESFRLYNVTIFPTRSVSGKLLYLFLVSNKSKVVDFFQMPFSWSNHDMLFVAVGVVERHVRSFRNIDLSDLLEVASGLDWNAVRFISDVDSNDDYLYGLLSELIDVFAPVSIVKVGRSSSLSGIRHWIDSDVEQAVAERNRAYEIWRRNVNRVKGDRNWLASADRRRIAKYLLDARRSAFVSVNLDPDLPPKKLYSNLRQLGVINGSNRV